MWDAGHIPCALAEGETMSWAAPWRQGRCAEYDSLRSRAITFYRDVVVTSHVHWLRLIQISCGNLAVRPPWSQLSCSG